MEFFTNNIYLFIYILLWGTLLFIQWKKTKKFGPCTVVIGLCFVFSVLSLLLYNDKLYNFHFMKLKLFPFLYLFFMFWLMLLPSIKYERANVKYIKMPSDMILNCFLLFYAILTLAMLPGILSHLKTGLYLLFADSSGGSELYQAQQNVAIAYDHSISGVYGLLSILYNFLNDIAIFFFFYYLSLKNKKRIYVILYSISILCSVLISIASGGRTPFVMQLYLLLIAFFIFYRCWDVKLRRKMKKIAVAFLVIISIPFIALTISRFGDKYTIGGTTGSMLVYAGQAPLNFDLYVMDANGTRHGDRTCNEFKRILGFDVPNNIPEVRNKYSYMKIDDSVFYTFVGDFVLDFGPISAFIIFLFLSFVFIRMSRCRGNTISIQNLMMVYFTLAIVAQGAMYLFYYSFAGNFKIIMFLIMYFVLFYDSCTQKNKRYLTVE